MENDAKIKTIISTASVSAVGAALIPVPVADAVMITGIQVGMLISISSVYGTPINKDTAKGFLMTYGTAMVGMWFASLLKGIPGVGTGVGMAISATVAGSLTATLGLAFNALMKSGKPITKENFQKAKDATKDEAANMVQELKRKTKKTEELKNSIAFRALPEKFVDRVEFFFNNGIVGGKKSIRVTEINGSDIVWKTKLMDDRQPVVWESSKNIPNGTYIAYLDIEDLIPIAIKLKK